MPIFPIVDFFQMMYSMASYYRIDMVEAFQCLFESSIKMMPGQEKKYFSEAYESHPYSQQAFKWVFDLHQTVNKYIHQTVMISYEEQLKKYANSSMNIIMWSHPTWKMIHWFAANHNGSKDYALAYKAFISCLQFCLPCEKCRTHLRENLADHPIDQFLSSRINLFHWSYLLHERVNGQLGKPSKPWKEATESYM